MLAVTVALTVMVTVLEVAGLPVAQVAFEVIVHVTVFPFVNAAFVYVALFVPTFTPFNFHWYVGVVPPLVGVAVNVTEVPEQTGFADAAILILTGKFGLTVMVTALEVAGLPVAHVAFEVKTQVTISTDARAALVYVELLVPTLTPFNNHW
jgi:hypothetical protein